MSVRLSRRAEMDLFEITEFIALDSPERAFQFATHQSFAEPSPLLPDQLYSTAAVTNNAAIQHAAVI